MKPQKNYTLGLDIGGTNMRGGLFDGKKIIADYSLATPKDSLDHFYVMLGALIEPLLAQAKEMKIAVAGIGLGIAGKIDYANQTMILSPNITNINGAKISKYFQEKYNLPTIMDNDAACFLRAEMMLGAGKKHKNAYALIIGTGIGGAWWVNNNVYQGANQGSGEPGRMIIDFEKGLELEARYQQLTGRQPIELAARALRAEPIATNTFRKIGETLGVAMANIVNLVDPEIIIFGGGVAGSSDLFVNDAKKIMTKYVMNPESKKIKIVNGKLADHAGMVGAALLIKS
jgi:glucokinase